MNERIRELALKAEQYVKSNPQAGVTIHAGDMFNKKFAELLVKECYRALWTEECHTSDLAVEEYDRNVKKIRQHFGV